MKYYNIGSADMAVPAVLMGCMHLSELDLAGAQQLISTALEQGVNFFDHADVYGDGACEALFARAMRLDKSLRGRILLQSKCGIVKEGGGYYDFSRQHILQSVEGILRRLETDYLDVLLLHRPDALMQPEEVAAAFDSLHERGMVRQFGVSNQNPMQMELLQQTVRQKLLFNQLQFSIAHTPMVDSGICVNTGFDGAVMREGGVLEYCRLKGVTIQAWSPFQRGFFEGVFLGDSEHYPALNDKIAEIAQRYGVTDTAIAVAWILRHPAGMQVVTGTTKPERLAECAAGADVVLTRQEWYELYQAAGNVLP